MKRIVTTVLAGVLGLSLVGDSALGADRARQQNRDGSCQSYAQTSTKKATKKQARQRDGSGKKAAACQGAGTCDGTQQRDRARDGSCK